MKIHEQLKKHRFENQVDADFIFDTLEYLNGEVLIPREVEDGTFNFLPFFGDEEDEMSSINFHPFHKVERYRKIIGMDSSVIPIAESKDGFVLGLKGSVVIEFNDSYEVVVLGPTPIYISLKNIKIFTDFLGYPKEFVKRASLDIGYAKKLAVDVFETKILMNILEEYKDSVILLDGSLVGLFKYGKERFSHVLNLANLHNNFLAGISKKSRLMKRYPYFYKVTMSHGVPGALEIPKFIIKKNFLFSIFISLFKSSGLPFRVDIPLNENPISILNQIYSSSITPVGYPEVLKESHILSKFSRFEILVLKRYLEFRGAYFVSTERLRDMIFGAFNKSNKV